MISLHIVFFLMIIFFALIGYLRGWQKEVIALTGLVASIAFLSTFGAGFLNRFPSAIPDPSFGPEAVVQANKTRFLVQAIFHCTLAFFSYQVVTRLADQVSGGRIGERVRANLEKRIIGALIGAINGYLLIGGLWAFLEYEIMPGGYVQLPPGVHYAFDPLVIRQAAGTAAMQVASTLLPLTDGISPTIWLILFFIAFFVVIVALI
jgi:uncharacterized membrane protein required for colicin V production